MATYIDTGVLVKLYCPEPDSPKAVEAVQSRETPWVFTPWQRLEIHNALRLKAFRKEISARQLSAAMARLQGDLQAGVLMSSPVDTEAVFARAEELSSACTVRLGSRTLDIIHVAAAVVLGVKDFVTFDRRQAGVAMEAGLKVFDG